MADPPIGLYVQLYFAERRQHKKYKKVQVNTKQHADYCRH